MHVRPGSDALQTHWVELIASLKLRTTQLRRIACACAPAVFPWVDLDVCRVATEVAERAVDGKATPDELEVARSATAEAAESPPASPVSDAARRVVSALMKHYYAPDCAAVLAIHGTTEALTL